MTGALAVLAAAPAALADIADIRPPLLPPDGPPLAILAALALVGLAAVALFVAWALRRLVRVRRAAAPTPRQNALRDLAGLAGEADDPRLLYFRLTGVLRGFLAGARGIPAEGMTVEELALALEGSDIEAEARQALLDVFRQAERATYAGAAPDPGAPARHLAWARAFIDSREPGDGRVQP